MLILRKLWNGDYPLIRAFWLFFIAGMAGAFLLATVVSAGFLFMHARPLALISFAVIFGGYFFVASVGVWQSATRYPYTRWWPFGAKLVVVIWGGRIVWGLINGGAENFISQVMR